MADQDYYAEQTGESENILTNLLYRYLPYWPLFVALALVFGSAGWAYMHYAVPVYESSAKILIKDEKRGEEESRISESLNLLGSKKIVENEIEVIQSVNLTTQIVKNLHLYAPIREDDAVIDASAYTSSPVTVELEDPDNLHEVKKQPFSYDMKTGLVKTGNQLIPLNQWVDIGYGNMRFVPNTRYRQPKQKKPLYFSLVSVYKMASALLDKLEATAASKTSTIIYLKVKDEIAARGEDILNELIRTYNQASISDKNILAANTLHFIEDRLDLVAGDLDSVEGRLQRFKTKQGIVDMSEQGKQFLETVGTNDLRVSELDVQLAVLDQVEDYVSGKRDKAGIVPSTLGVNDPVLSGLLDKLYAAELEYASLRKTTGPKNPVLISLQEEIDKIKPGIMENIRNQRRNLEAGKLNINTANSKYSSLLQAMPQKERELLEISRQQSIKNNIYTFLLQKREETALSYASTVADSRIVDRAHTTVKPVSPRRILVYGIAFLLAMALGIGFVTVKEGMNRSLLFRADIEKATEFPIIGEIIQNRSKNPLVISPDKRNFIGEQFRQLRTSLGYLGINSWKKKILVTSTISGEGKSFIAANLGLSLAVTGKKVVLLELDLRKPKLSALFNIEHETGFTEYFNGEKEAAEVLKSSGQENLFIIPSGSIPPNPSELILNGRLQEILNYLETEFDYIIIDTAPVNPVTDAYLLSPFCDVTLYIIRHGFTPKAYVKMLNSNNKVRVLRNVGIVFNGVRSRGFGRNRFDYGFGYGNGIGANYIQEGRSKKQQRKKGTTA